jgi:hypothetical protein
MQSSGSIARFDLSLRVTEFRVIFLVLPFLNLYLFFSIDTFGQDTASDINAYKILTKSDR